MHILLHKGCHRHCPTQRYRQQATHSQRHSVVHTQGKYVYTCVYTSTAGAGPFQETVLRIQGMARLSLHNSCPSYGPEQAPGWCTASPCLGPGPVGSTQWDTSSGAWGAPLLSLQYYRYNFCTAQRDPKRGKLRPRAKLDSELHGNAGPARMDPQASSPQAGFGT